MSENLHKVSDHTIENDKAICSYKRMREGYCMAISNKKTGDNYFLKNEDPITWSVTKNGKPFMDRLVVNSSTHDLKDVKDFDFMGDLMQKAVVGIARQCDSEKVCLSDSKVGFMEIAMRYAGLSISKNGQITDPSNIPGGHGGRE